MESLTGTVKLTDDELNVVRSYINKSDEYVDIIVHSDEIGENFSVVIEMNGKVEKVFLTTEEFAKALQKIPSDKTIRLLSCNSVDSAQDISKILDREIISSSGEMRIYENGVIQADNWHSASPNGNIKKVDINQGTPRGKNIVLKEKFVNNISASIKAELKVLYKPKARYDEFIDMVTRSQLPGTWTIKKIDGKLVVVDKKQKIWAELYENSMKAVAGKEARKWNHLLNVDPPLMKNFIYEVNDGKFIFETDELGRVIKAKMNPVVIDKSVVRNQTAQSHTKTVKDGSTINVDDGGHIFRNEWAGPSEQINYFSQNAVENRRGAWYNMEDAISKMLKSDNPPGIKLEMEFNFVGASKRPVSVDVEVYVKKRGTSSFELHELSDTYPNPL